MPSCGIPIIQYLNPIHFTVSLIVYGRILVILTVFLHCRSDHGSAKKLFFLIKGSFTPLPITAILAAQCVWDTCVAPQLTSVPYCVQLDVVAVFALRRAADEQCNRAGIDLKRCVKRPCVTLLSYDVDC